MDDREEIFHLFAFLLEVAGLVSILFGAVWASAIAIRLFFKKDSKGEIYKSYRKNLGEGILLGLEFLVAGDIIKSVAVEPTFKSIGVLGLIVLVRTFLSFTLEVEMNGRWPWQKKKQKSL